MSSIVLYDMQWRQTLFLPAEIERRLIKGGKAAIAPAPGHLQNLQGLQFQLKVQYPEMCMYYC